MTIKLYDLTCAHRRIFFSPFCWRTRMALLHKGLAFESVPWHFTDTEALAPSGGNRVPVIVDGDRWVHDSWTIARYLDETYPDSPSLMANSAARALAKFIDSWCGATVFAALRPIAVPHVYGLVAEKDKAYFKESRERLLGLLDQLSKDPAAERAALNKALAPANDALGEAPFLAGNAPDYSDYVLFGTLMWPAAVCPGNPIDSESPTGAWFERMLDLYDAHARKAPKAAAA